jgi:hypothetical protein
VSGTLAADVAPVRLMRHASSVRGTAIGSHRTRCHRSGALVPLLVTFGTCPVHQPTGAACSASHRWAVARTSTRRRFRRWLPTAPGVPVAVGPPVPLVRTYRVRAPCCLAGDADQDDAVECLPQGTSPQTSPLPNRYQRYRPGRRGRRDQRRHRPGPRSPPGRVRSTRPHGCQPAGLSPITGPDLRPAAPERSPNRQPGTGSGPASSPPPDR